jgi:hypothetical protein
MYFRGRFAEDNRIGCRDRVRGMAVALTESIAVLLVRRKRVQVARPKARHEMRQRGLGENGAGLAGFAVPGSNRGRLAVS